MGGGSELSGLREILELRLATSMQGLGTRLRSHDTWNLHLGSQPGADLVVIEEGALAPRHHHPGTAQDDLFKRTGANPTREIMAKCFFELDPTEQHVAPPWHNNIPKKVRFEPENFCLAQQSPFGCSQSGNKSFNAN
jgi:hypothetical protein